jgi:hypothetical protein
MADETATTETPNSPATTDNPSTASNPESGSSTTDPANPPADDKIDLAAVGSDPAPSGDEPAKTELTDDEKTAEEARAALFGAPDGDAGYEITGLPEGMTIDEAALEAVTPVFKELGLSNAGASKVASIYAEKVLPAVGEQFKTQLQQQVLDQRTEWEGETLAAIKGESELKTATGDKIDFGGAGVKQVQQVAAKALDRIAPAGFRDFLEQTGLGQHPAMVAFAYKVGQLISEDSDIGGGGGGDPAPKTRESKYYNR